MHQIFKDHSSLIQSSRGSIAPLLLSLWKLLHPVFDLTDNSESNVWCEKAGSKLILSSCIDLKVGKTNLMDSLNSIHEAHSVLEGFEERRSLKTLQLMKTLEGTEHYVELFHYVGVPFIFCYIYLVFDLMVESFDAQALSNSYFDFIRSHGLLYMSKEVIIPPEEETVSEKDEGSLSIYGGLYEKGS